MKLDGDGVLKRFSKAKNSRSNWEDLWQDIYDYVMPAREGFYQTVEGEERTDDILDETALVSTNEFVSRLSQGLIPAFDKWWRFEPGPEITDPAERRNLQGPLDDVTNFVWEALHNSNFYNEAQESLYDIAVGWSTMIVDDGDDGQLLKFKTLPQCQTFWDAGPFKQVDGVFRVRHNVRLVDIKTIWPQATLSDELAGKLTSDPEAKTHLVEASYRDWNERKTPVYYYQVAAVEDKSLVIDEEQRGLGARPYITPRWQVAAGETYGRGPLICALPAIRTTNLVTEMILENAQMAISGIWQIDDDGTINADNVEIVPGAVYARPSDSRGLERTDMSGASFNVADIVLATQQENIRKALFAENLGPVDQTPRSATEINARMQNLSEQVAGPSARLKAEWLDPLLQRCVYLLKRQGVLEMPRVDGREIRIVSKSPLARAQRFNDIERIRGFAGDVIGILGPQAAQLFLDQNGVVSQLQEKWEIPVAMLRSEAEVGELMQSLTEAAQQQPAPGGLPAQAEIGQ